MHVGSYDVNLKPTVRNYNNSSRWEYNPRVDPPINSEDLIRQIVHKVYLRQLNLSRILVEKLVRSTSVCVPFELVRDMRTWTRSDRWGAWN